MGGSHPHRFKRFTASTALSGSTFCKPPALPEVADSVECGNFSYCLHRNLSYSGGCIERLVQLLVGWNQPLFLALL